MGLDKKILKHFSKTGKGKREITELYGDIQTIDNLHLDPIQYFSMHRWDRLVLKYYLLVKMYNEEKYLEESQKKVEQEWKQKEKEVELMNKLPKQEFIGRRGL